MRGLGFYNCLILQILLIIMLITSCGKNPNSEEYFPESSSNFLNSDYLLQPDSSINQTAEIFVQMGHTSTGYTSNTVAEITKDGKYILSGNVDGKIIMWETETCKEVKTLRCLDDVTNLALSSDGRYLASSDRYYVKNVNVWEISSGRKKQSFSIEVTAGAPVLFCNNDKNILAGGSDEILRLWDIESGELIREFKTAPKDTLYGTDISSMILTPDGKKVIVGYQHNASDENGNRINTGNKSIRIMDINAGESVLSFNDVGCVSALGITPDGKELISLSWQDSARVWDPDTGRQIRAFLTNGASAIDISAGGRYALLGGGMSFGMIEIKTGKIIRKIDKGINGGVQSIKFSPDGKSAIVGDQVPQPKMWDLSTGKLIKSFGGYSGQTMTAQISGSGNVLMTAHGYSNSVSLWEYRNGNQLRVIKNKPECLSSTATVNSDGSRAGFGGWDMETNKPFAAFSSADDPDKIIKISSENSGTHSKAPVFFKDGNRIVWATNTEVIISSLSDGSEIKRIKISNYNEIYRISLSSGEEFVLVSDRIDSSYVISIEQEKTIFAAGGKCAFSKDGLKLFSVKEYFDENKIFISETDLLTLEEKRVVSAVFPGSEIIGEKIRVFNYIKNVCAGSDPETIFFSDDKNIYKVDMIKSEITVVFQGHTDRITSIGTTPDGLFLFSASDDGTTRFWDAVTGKEVAQFISFSDGEWIVITPEGYFNSSPNGAKYINVRIGNQVFSIDNFYEKYYNPAYIASVLQGNKVQPVADIRQGIALPPEVKIISPETNSEFKNEEVTITISAKDMGGGIDEIRLYHNGKAIGEDTRGIEIVPKENTNTKTYIVTLVDGDNTFRAIGFSRDRTESNPSGIVIKLLAPEKDISLFVLSVGINKYKNPALNLNYAEPDARGIADFFKQSGTELFKKVEIKDIYNEQATKAGIISKLKELENTNPQDAVLIYLAGHGENINEKWYFIPHELTYPEREDDVKSKAISSDELSESIKAVKAQKVLVLIDACKSGAVLLAFRGFEDRKALSQLSRAVGVHVVAASSKDQYAAEVKDLGHGAFTYTLLEGLKGKAAGKGENITVRKLMGYIEEQLPELTKRYRQEAQYPVVDSRGMDFPLVKGR
jgi:WD40 repeat protein